MQTSPAFAQEPMDPELSGERRRRKRRGGGGFFGGKKFAWFTWLLTFVDIGVFVGELVESGTCFYLLPVSNRALTNYGS